MSAKATPISKEGEAKLQAGVRHVAASVSAGLTPSAAVVKAARDLNYPPSMVPLLVHAFNVGRATMQREKAAGDLGTLLGEYPLANLETVMDTLYPADPAGVLKSAAAAQRAEQVPVEFLRPPSVVPLADRQEKQALAAQPIPWAAQYREQPPDPGPLSRVDAQLAAKRACQDAVRRGEEQAARLHEQIRQATVKLASYFLRHDRKPFSEVAHFGRQLFGPAAEEPLKYAYAAAGLREPAAAAEPKYAAYVDRHEPPYSLLGEVVKLAGQYLATRQQLAEQQQRLTKEAARGYDPFGRELPAPLDPDQPQPLPSSRPSGTTPKSAGFFGTLLGTSTAGLLNSYRASDFGKPKEKRIEDAQLELSDPDHTNELRAIEARTMLHDLLTNDDVISGYDPAEVFNAYNEIAQLAPRASTQPAVMRSLLRKRLTQGSQEPFEAQQIADIEHKLTQTVRPTSELTHDQFIAG